MTDNKKYVKRGQALIIRDDPQRYEEVTGANKNKVDAPFQYAESLFMALAMVKSMTGLPYRHLQGSEDAITCQCARHGNAAARIATFKIKYAKHSCTEKSIRRWIYDEDAFTCVQTTYAETFLGLEFLPRYVVKEYTQIRQSLAGLQDYTINYNCGYCGVVVAGIVVTKYKDKSVHWLACPNCKRGSVSNGRIINPSPLRGEDIRGLPETIKSVYMEARKSFSSDCHTACELLCRKILMNVAVERGAPEGKGFAQYIDYMSEEGHVTNAMKPWIKKIKDNGNEATHKINPPDFERANTTLEFTILLLKNVYETAYRMKSDSGESI